jgi:cardiolipin synthase
MGKYFIFIPNLLSIIRIFLMYPLLAFISEENFLFALYIFAIAAATDGLDGYLARVMDWQTDLGRILDPIADKVLLIGTILTLWLNGYIPFFVLAIFVLRDLMIVIGAAFHMTVYETATPAPSLFGKVTTFSHIAYLVSVFMDIIFSLNITNFIVDLAVAIITSISLILYGSNWFALTAKLHRE